MEWLPPCMLKASVKDYYGGGRKRIFIGILCATCVVICLCLLSCLILPWFFDAAYLRYLSIGIGVTGICLLAWLCIMLVFHIYTGKPLPGISSVRHVLIRLMLPLMEIVGKLFGIDKNLIRRSFIRVNNEFVLSNQRPVSPDKLLLLLPHCIQASACPRRLLFSINNCADCGKCQIGLLRKLAEEHGFRIAIASGGTVARRIVVECKPECIVAIACERDLSSGIQDSYPIPVYGVLNKRPLGPCKDTRVAEDQLRQVLSCFLRKNADKECGSASPDNTL